MKYYYLLVLLTVFSCVPNRKIVYLQHQEELEDKQVYPTDTLLRSYQLKKEPYRLKAEDIISLRVASITDQEFNFIQQYEMQLGVIRKLNQYTQNNRGGGFQGNQNMGLNQFGGGNNAGGLGTMGMMGLMGNLNTGFKIDSQGSLELPQVGEVQLAGLTITEAEELLKEKLLGFYETPMVRIELLNFHFTILGEVEQEGMYTTFDPEFNVFQAIMLAGNLTELADRSRIKIVRKYGEQAEVLYLNTLEEDLLAARNFYLSPDDLIIVPPLKARYAQRYTVPRLSTVIGIVSSSLSLIALVLTLSNR